MGLSARESVPIWHLPSVMRSRAAIKIEVFRLPAWPPRPVCEAGFG
jgi:hypothetical protein